MFTFFEIDIKSVKSREINRIFGVFFGERSKFFHLVNTIGNIFTRGCATRENITNGVHSMK